MPKVKTKRTREASQRSRLGTRQLEALIEEAIIDAYDESEQRVGFLTMLEEHLAVPFATEILGTASVSNASLSTTPTRSWRSVAADANDR
jgi:hypothetical protein